MHGVIELMAAKELKCAGSVNKASSTFLPTAQFAGFARFVSTHSIGILIVSMV